MGNIISQEARKRQAIVKYALKKGKSKAAAMYGVSEPFPQKRTEKQKKKRNKNKIKKSKVD